VYIIPAEWLVTSDHVRREAAQYPRLYPSLTSPLSLPPPYR